MAQSAPPGIAGRSALCYDCDKENAGAAARCRGRAGDAAGMELLLVRRGGKEKMSEWSIPDQMERKRAGKSGILLGEGSARKRLPQAAARPARPHGGAQDSRLSFLQGG